ncbi:MAG: phosphotransferase [Caulobacterales bacterium]
MNKTFPRNVEALTTDWLDKAFAQKPNAPRVLDSKTDRIIWGTATKVLMNATCKDAAGNTFNKDICVKGGFDERLRQYYDLGVMFLQEAVFYRDVAPQLDILLPECLYADDNGSDGVVVLENLAARGATFGDPTKPLTPNQALPILEMMAELHAVTWNWPTSKYPWLVLGSPSQRDGITAMAAGDRFRELSTRPQVARSITPPYGDGELMMSALRYLWERDDKSSALALGHGDAHIGQLYFEPDGRAGLLDWQSIAMMPYAKDIAYFLGSALTVDDRRAHERDLIAAYLQALQKRGGPKIALSETWEEYRAQMLQGMVWIVVTENMQPIEVIETLNERYLTAMRDLDTLGALGF